MKFQTLSLWLNILVPFTLPLQILVAHAEPILDPGLYEKVYPEYAEFCALSQIRKKPGFGIAVEGGTGGHGVLYLHGACRDHSFSYPRIKLCGPEDRGRSSGTGISVNSDFRNVNWTAVEGKRFFFAGDLKTGESVTRASYQRTQAVARRQGILDGILPHPEILSKALPGMSARDYLYEDSIGTDYAISFGRKMYCAKIPLSHGQLGQAVAHLNELNRHYHDDGIDYQWNVFNNNCTHTAHNALAAAGFGEPLAIDRPVIFELLNLAIPVNDFAAAVTLANDLPLENPLTLFGNASARKAMLEQGELPTRPGGLVEFLSVQRDNELYETDLGSMLVDVPGIHPVNRSIRRYFTQDRYLDVKANLLYFKDRYGKVKTSLHPLQWYLYSFQYNPPANPKDPSDFITFYAKYLEYLDRELLDIERRLAVVDAAGRTSAHRTAPSR